MLVAWTRHAESPHNIKKIYSSSPLPMEAALTPRGLMQAEIAGKEFQKLRELMGIRGEHLHVHSSPLLRAHRTAETVARWMGLTDVHVTVALRERSYGDLEGKEEPSRSWKLEAERYNAETFDQLKSRVHDFLRVAGDGFHVAVTHKDMLIAAVGDITKKPESELLDNPSPNAGITLIDYDAGKVLFEGERHIPATFAPRAVAPV